MDSELEHSPALREEQHRRVRVGGQQVQRVILFAGAAWRLAARGRTRALESDASALLRTKDAQGLPLHIAAMRQGHNNVFLRHQIFS